MNELERLRARRAQAAAAHQKTIGEIADAGQEEGSVATDTTELETRAAFESATVEKLDKLIDGAVALELRSQATAEAAKKITGSPSTERIEVGNEPMEYRAGAKHGFFHDVFLAQQGDAGARERLAKNDEQMKDASIEYRALTLTDGTGGGYVAPKVLVDDVIPLRRAGRVVADLVSHRPLLRTDVIQIPKVLTGTLTGVQTAVNTSLANADPTDSMITTNVRTIGGFLDIPQQLLDFSDINQDQFWFSDLRRDLEKQVENQVLNGTNAAGQLQGILTSAGIQNVAWVDATPTVPEFYTQIGKAMGLVEDAIFAAPEHMVLATRRNVWLQTQVDASGRPFVLPTNQGAQNSLMATNGKIPATGYAGSLLGLDIYSDTLIPKTLGAGTEDVALVADLRETYLYESPIFTRIDYGVGSGTLTVRLVAWKYAASSGALRLPTAYCTVTGTGMIAP